MIPFSLCLLAFVTAYVASRRSLAGGIIVVLLVGYLYGILRANVFSPVSQFIFDAAVVGLYLPQFRRRSTPEERERSAPLRPWLTALIVWPCILLAFPVQEPEILLVGLRASVFFLPFLWLGSRLESDDVLRISLALAVLNLVALSFATAEYLLGVDRFYPHNALTELIYNSRDVLDAAGVSMLRIPGTFSSASAFAGTMVLSLPFLFGAWVRRGGRTWQRLLLMFGLGAGMLGVFLAASRSHTVVLFLVLLVVTLSGTMRPVYKFAWLGILGAVAYVVVMNDRLQRFLLLLDTGLVSKRVSGSVNSNFFDLLIRYPMGNGLGGGGTNIPGFLSYLMHNPVWMENEYSRILLEQGIPGLALWLAFLAWLYSRRTIERSDPWVLGRRLVWYTTLAYFATGVIGVGLLSSVPQTALMLMAAGWIAVRRRPAAAALPRVAVFTGLAEGRTAVGSHA